jgi:hypothetical protein
MDDEVDAMRDAEPTPPAAAAPTAEELQARADAAIVSIREGGDITQESLALANRFTDDATETIGRTLRRMFRKRS